MTQQGLPQETRIAVARDARKVAQAQQMGRAAQ